MPRRTIVIGDIHGCLGPLDALLDAVGLTASDRLISLGDLLDKGPHGPRVVARLRRLAEDGRDVTLVRGNHEDKNLRYLAHARRPSKNPIADPTGELARQTAALTAADEAFLRASVLHHALPGTPFLCVHAGIPPSMKRLPETNVDGRKGAVRKFAGQLMRVRRVDDHGHMVSLAATRPEHAFWAERYDGRFGHVLFGHRAFDRPAPARFPHATGLDLGCVHGGHLCAAIVPDGTAHPDDLSFVTVPNPDAQHPWGPVVPRATAP